MFSTEDAALFVCVRGPVEKGDLVLACFGHYGTIRPIYQEEIKCGSKRLPMLLTFLKGGKKPEPNSDFDFSKI